MAKLTTSQIQTIKMLARQGFSKAEVSRKTGVSVARLGNLGSSVKFQNGQVTRFKEVKAKKVEIHLYRLKHGTAKTAKKFKLTPGQISHASQMATKRNPDLPRFDNRRRDPWSAKELTYLLKYAGIKSRQEINEKLKRGKTDIVIKEKLDKLGVSSKNMNGISFLQFQNIFGEQPELFVNGTRFKIIPYCYIVKFIRRKRIKIDDSLRIYFETMATFQKWIHGGNLKMFEKPRRKK